MAEADSLGSSSLSSPLLLLLSNHQLVNCVIMMAYIHTYPAVSPAPASSELYASPAARISRIGARSLNRYEE